MKAFFVLVSAKKGGYFWLFWYFADKKFKKRVQVAIA